MPINPNTRKNLKGAENPEFIRIILGLFRYDSPSGRQIADAITYEKETGDVIGKSIEAFSGDFTDGQVIDSICSISPDFAENLMNYSVNIPENDRTFSLLLDKFSEYIVEQYKAGNTNKFSEIFDLIEQCLSRGTETVHHGITTNVLENIQNFAGNQDINPNVFLQYLGKNSEMWWNEIDRFWHDLEKYYKTKYPDQPG